MSEHLFPAIGQEPFNLTDEELGREANRHSLFKAIETRFKGWRFRSRLEARWAVLFNCLDIEFHYEPEGYQLPSGVWYLPDFFLPQVEMWAECKPVAFTPVEKNKCKELVDATGYPCLLLVGPPDFRTYDAIFSADLEGGTEIQGTRWESDCLLDIEWHRRRYYEQEKRFYSCTGGFYKEPSDFSEQYRWSVHTARSERFTGAA